jgi:hypothetical protein
MNFPYRHGLTNSEHGKTELKKIRCRHGYFPGTEGGYLVGEGGFFSSQGAGRLSYLKIKPWIWNRKNG